MEAAKVVDEYHEPPEEPLGGMREGGETFTREENFPDHSVRHLFASVTLNFSFAPAVLPTR
jgi:hypothetical protein